MDEELKQILNMVMNHNEEIEKLNLYIKMRNGNYFKYRIDRIKEMKIFRHNERKTAKQKKYEEQQIQKKELKRKKLEEKQMKKQKEN